MARLQIFLVVSTCFLYLVAAGLFARSVWYFEQGHWHAVVGADVGEAGSGPGSYDIDRSVWHVNVGAVARAVPLIWIADLVPVLQPRTQRRPRMGNLQWDSRVDKLGYL